MTLLYIALGTFGVIGIIYLILFIYQKKMSKAIKEETKQTFLIYGTLKDEHQKRIFNLNGKTYQIMYFHVPIQSELTINSTTMWEIRDKGKSELINQQHFLSSTDPKIIIIYPSQGVIKRYINENEMEFVKYNKMFYNMYIVRSFELENLLKELNNA